MPDQLIIFTALITIILITWFFVNVLANRSFKKKDKERINSNKQFIKKYNINIDKHLIINATRFYKNSDTQEVYIKLDIESNKLELLQ